MVGPSVIRAGGTRGIGGRVVRRTDRGVDPAAEEEPAVEPEPPAGPSFGLRDDEAETPLPSSDRPVEPEAEARRFEQPTLTGEPAAPYPDPERPRASGETFDEEDEGDDRSLRELFWGED